MAVHAVAAVVLKRSEVGLGTHTMSRATCMATDKAVAHTIVTVIRM